jgi:hypothetical protein
METIPSRRYASRITATIVVACTASQTSGSENGTKGAVLPVGRGIAREANSSEMPNKRTMRHEPLGLTMSAGVKDAQGDASRAGRAIRRCCRGVAD